jgi:hypothetical protein
VRLISPKFSSLCYLSRDGDHVFPDVIRPHPRSRQVIPYPCSQLPREQSSITFIFTTTSFVISIRKYCVQDKGLETFVERSMQVKAIQLSTTRTIPNSRLPLLYYANTFPQSTASSQIESRFRSNGWIPQVSPPPPNLTL